MFTNRRPVLEGTYGLPLLTEKGILAALVNERENMEASLLHGDEKSPAKAWAPDIKLPKFSLPWDSSNHPDSKDQLPIVKNEAERRKEEGVSKILHSI